jgi:predicted HicB family RNase H-like nuclease
MKRSSVITPPPQLPEAETGTDIVAGLTEEQRRAEMLKLVRRGAPSIAPSSEPTDRARYSVRMPRQVLARATAAANSRDVMTPLNTWIIEAILAQLKKEGL